MEMSEPRRWEDLEHDCLVNIIGRVGMRSLVLDVPFVCKSWYKASLDPSCWQNLDFSDLSDYLYPTSTPDIFVRKFKRKYKVKKFTISGLIRLVVPRGTGKSTCVSLLRGSSLQDVKYVVAKCPELKSLSLRWDALKGNSITPKLIEKLKLLEEISLQLNSLRVFRKIFAQIGDNCKNFNSLSLSGEFNMDVALAIANHIPRIKKLSLLHCCVNLAALEIIIRSCKELEYFDVSKCETYCFWDEKRLKEQALHVKTFNLDVYAEPIDYYVNYGYSGHNVSVPYEVPYVSFF